MGMGSMLGRDKVILSWQGQGDGEEEANGILVVYQHKSYILTDRRVQTLQIPWVLALETCDLICSAKRSRTHSGVVAGAML